MKKRKILIALLTFIFLFIGAFEIVHAEDKPPIEMIFASAGEDASTEYGISWHSTSSACTLVYTDVSDTSYQKATKINVTGKLSDVNYSEKNELGRYYIFQVNLTGLDPDTKYQYRIQAVGSVSKTHYFKTSGYGGTFNFMLLSDVHARNDDVNAISWDASGKETGALKNLILAAEKYTADCGGIDTICFDGDFVRYGQVYKNWRLYNDSYISTNYGISLTMGNHEYYDKGHNGTDQQIWTSSMVNNPHNANTGYDQDFWILFNNVLIIAFDNCESHEAKLRPWLEEVFKQNKGKYQYCIVYHHYPDFTINNGTGQWCDYGSFSLSDIWDKYNVDLVVGADSHDYLRTKKLYNKQPSTTDQGTVYITTTAIYSGSVGVKNSTNKWFEKVSTGSAAGGLLFYVTPTEMKVDLFSPTQKVVDTVTFKARHEFVLRDELVNSVENSFEYINIDNSNEGYVVCNQQATSIVKKIEIYDGANLIGSNEPLISKLSSIKINGITPNSVKTLTAKVTYTNDETHSVNFIANTNSYCGYVTKFNCGISNGQAKLSWDEIQLSSTVDKIKLYRNDELLTTLDKGVKEYTFTKSEKDEDATYTLELVTSGGEVLHQYKCMYIAYGDLNSDGVVNRDDMSLIENAIISKTTDDKIINISDINRDGGVSYLDLLLVYRNIEEGLSLANDEYIVTFKNIDGTVLSKQVIKYGQGATAPTNPALDGFNFMCWSDDYSYITSNKEIIAVYSK